MDGCCNVNITIAPFTHIIFHAKQLELRVKVIAGVWMGTRNGGFIEIKLPPWDDGRSRRAAWRYAASYWTIRWPLRQFTPGSVLLWKRVVTNELEYQSFLKTCWNLVRERSDAAKLLFELPAGGATTLLHQRTLYNGSTSDFNYLRFVRGKRMFLSRLRVESNRHRARRIELLWATVHYDEYTNTRRYWKYRITEKWQEIRVITVGKLETWKVMTVIRVHWGMVVVLLNVAPDLWAQGLSWSRTLRFKLKLWYYCAR